MTSRINCSLSLGLHYCSSRQCTCSNFSWFVVLLTNFHVLQIIKVFQLKENFETTLISLLASALLLLSTKNTLFLIQVVVHKVLWFQESKTLKQSQHCILDKSHPERSTSASPFAGNGAENGCCLFGLLSLHSSCWLDGPFFPDFSANSPIFKPQVMLMLF